MVVNFWQSSCDPCKLEARDIAAASRAWTAKRSDVVFLGVDAQDLKGPAHAYLKRYGVTYTNVRDALGRTWPSWGVTGARDVLHRSARPRRAAAHRGAGVPRADRRRHPSRAALVRLAVAALAALVLAAPAAACTQQASQAYLETRLVCITCHTTLDESNSTFAIEMKTEIARQIKACRTNTRSSTRWSRSSGLQCSRRRRRTAST